MKEAEERKAAERWGWVDKRIVVIGEGVLIGLLLLAALLLALRSQGQEAAAQQTGAASKETWVVEAIVLNQEEAGLLRLRREAWQERGQRAEAVRMEYERAIEARSEARVELVGEVERLRNKHKVPQGWTLDFETMKFSPPQGVQK